MRIAPDWLDRAGPQAVMAALMRDGHRAWFVGGCVRNALLGRADSDIDIATTARPHQTVAAAGRAGLKSVPTGADHGTITVVAGGEGYEVTTLRRDVETDGRHARVTFSWRIEEDAARRDFTMNALYAEADGRVVDPLEGLPDLRAGRVRFIGEAEERIAEDYLRILRFFRFTAWYGRQGPDATGLAACAALAEGLGRIAAERKGQEMRKLLAAPDPAPVVATMAQAGILAQVLPGAQAQALAPLIHLEDGLAPDPIRRLAVLGGTDPVAALRLSRAEARRLQLYRDALEAGHAPARIAQEHGIDRGRDLALIAAALTGQPLPPDLEPVLDHAAAARFPVTARDLMALGHQGAELGARLASLREAWIGSGFALDRAALLARAQD
ncbi:CCA tRNA nucleotidyltransferase [Mangrovicoccus algicola]|uniref:CCA tRNA nucleotidyltransferase n=1 Tax=Mangrovicoccus algicola TaxID=2771008 RepID=A0A8J6YXH7_9RHOB|nr:CCA tRNA nucleotidyltransferase [Mangrovicoccus algicola]MBE3638239.1 CCA tRNA nucleotidyltransferase [Mangrovicoccus algicola]